MYRIIYISTDANKECLYVRAYVRVYVFAFSPIPFATVLLITVYTVYVLMIPIG